jgi:GNAT superfamily N-acetyltransferase
MAENQAVPPAEEQQNRTDDVSLLHRDTWQEMMDTSDLVVYLAEAGNRAVGTAGMLTVPNLAYGCRRTAFIEPVVVKYAHRRRGVARALLSRALEAARALGCFKVQLLSHKRHPDDGAHELYRSMEFEAEAEGFRLYLPQG